MIRVNTQNIWSYVPYQTQWSQRTEQSPAWDSNNERRIINNCQKLQRTVFAKANQLFLYRPFRSSFKTVYFYPEKAVYRRCKCLERTIIDLNWRSVFGKIKYTKLPEHLCLLNKLLQLVLVRVLTWSCYMIGVILIFQSLCRHILIKGHLERFASINDPGNWTTNVA